MKRLLLNLAALAVIAGGNTLLSTPAYASEEDTIGGIEEDEFGFARRKCVAGSGATCYGSNCCADATTCWSSC
ncbi:MAG TPA: hypothetical protein VF263_24145 [Longimicrobiaceae bacterium]